MMRALFPRCVICRLTVSLDITWSMTVTVE